MKIAFLDTKTVGDLPNLHKFREFGEFITYPSTPHHQAADRIADVDVVISNKVRVSREAMDQASSLKLVCVAATGMNNVDREAAHEKGIAVKNVVDYSTHSVAQHTFSLLLSLLNNPVHHDQYVRSGVYSRGDMFTYLGAPFWHLNDKRFGIIGLGNIGKKVAEIAEAFGCQIVYYSSSGKSRHDRYQRLELDELLSTSDVVSVHAPLNTKTENLISYNKIRLMKSSAVLINTSRGGIINESDLAQACDDALIRGAGIDVFSQEPLPSDHPYLKLNKPERLLLTPHIAWTSEESRVLLVDSIYENIRTFLED